MLLKVIKKIDFTDYIHKSFIAALFLNFFRVGFQFLIGIVLVRGLGVSDYGYYAYIITLLNIIVLFSGIGMPDLSVREVSRLIRKKCWAELKDYIIQIHKINIIIIIVSILLAVSLLKIILSNRLDSHMINVAMLAVLLFPFLSLGLLRSGLLRGLKHPILAQLPEYFITPGIFLLLLVGNFLIFERIHFNLSTVFLLQLTAILCGFILGLFFLVKEMPKDFFITQRKVGKINTEVKRALPFLGLAGIALINSRFDIFLLGILRPAADVGVYQIALLFYQITALSAGIYTTIASPLIADAFYKNNKEELQRVVMLGTRIIFALTFLSISFLIIFGHWLLQFFYGPVFSQNGYIPLLILLASQLVCVSFGNANMILNMTGYDRITLRIMIAMVTLNILLNLLLIPYFGIIGSALATAISNIFGNLVLVFFAYQHLKINSFIFYKAKEFLRSVLK